MDPDAEELTFPQQSPFVATLDNLAANAFYDVAIKREASKLNTGPQWFEPVPCEVRYPFTLIQIPKYSGVSVRKYLKLRGSACVIVRMYPSHKIIDIIIIVKTGLPLSSFILIGITEPFLVL